MSDIFTVMSPLLVEQGKDQIYMKEGQEFVAYENLRQGKDNKEGAQEELKRI